MLKTAFNQANYNKSSFVGDQKAPQIPVHLKCGEVFIWLCAGELYAVECKLCEDHPLCPLSEFSQHMEIWHTDWEDDEEENQSHLFHAISSYNNDLALALANEDGSGSFKPNHELQNDRVTTSQEQHEEILEPFEQVLIEQDISMHTIQINDDANEEEYFKDASVQVAEAKPGQIESKQKQNINPTLKNIANEQKKNIKKITERERELQYLTELKESEAESNVTETNDLRNKHKSFQFQINRKNNKRVLLKCRNLKRNLRSINKNIQATNNTKASKAGNSESRENFNKSRQITKSIKENLSKIKKNKITLTEIVKDMSNLKKSDGTKNEIITIDYQNKNILKPLKTKYSNNNKKHLRNNRKDLKRFKKILKTENELSETEDETLNETSEMENETAKETSETEKERSGTKNESSKGDKRSSETENEIFLFEEITKQSAGLFNETEFVNTITGQIKKSFQIKDNGLTQNRKYTNKLRKITQSQTSQIKKTKAKENNKELSDNETNETELGGTTNITKIKPTEKEINSKYINVKESNHNEIVAILSETETQLNGNETKQSENETELSKNKINLIENENQRNEHKHRIETKNNNKPKHNKTETVECSTSLDNNKSVTISNESGTYESETLLNVNKLRRCEHGKGTSFDEANTDEYFKFDEHLKKSVEITTKTNELIQKFKKPTIKLNKNEARKNQTLVEENKMKPCENETENLKLKTENFLKNSKRQDLKQTETVTNENEKLLSESRFLDTINISGTSANDTNNEIYFEYAQKSLEIRKETEKYIKKVRKCKKNSNETESRTKAAIKQHECVTEQIGNETIYIKDNKLLLFEEPLFNEAHHLPKTRKSLRILRTNIQHSENTKKESEMETETELQKTNGKGRAETLDKETTSQIILRDNLKDAKEKKQNEIKPQEFNESERDENQNNRILKSSKDKAIKWKPLTDLKRSNEFKRKLRNYKNEKEDLVQYPFQHFKQFPNRSNTERNMYSIENNFNAAKRARRKSICRVSQEDTNNAIVIANSSKRLRASSDLQVANESSLPIVKIRRVEYKEGMKEDLPTGTTVFKGNTRNVQTKGNVNESCNKKEHESLLGTSCTWQEDSEKSTKQTLVTQFFANKDDKQEEASKRSENFESLEISEPFNFSDSVASQDSCTPLDTEPLSPLSTKTGEEHFEFYEPKEKLNKQHISHLIKLYHEHPRLWDQSHPEFCEPQVCRKSWQRITDQWNEFCKRKFTIAEVRIRICTLCQRFIQERDRLAFEGEVDDCAKFPYYEQMQFLEQQKSLQKRRELYDQQNEKILEIYQHFPILWHVSYYKLRKAKERAQAIESISTTLKVFGLHLSSMAVQKRLRSLRKCYRLEKIRHLHAQVEQTPFESMFRHYERMNFLDKHIDPFVCSICGKIFENLASFRQHLEAESHGSVCPEESEAESDIEKAPAEDSVDAASRELDSIDETFVGNLQELQFKEIGSETFYSSPITNHMEYFSESENSRDILQRFTPFSSTPTTITDSLTNLQLHTPENRFPIVQEVLNFPMDTANEPIINSLHLEDQLIEAIIENVTNQDSLSQQGLDQFISTVTSCDDSLDFEIATKNCVIEESLSPNIFHTENSFIVEHPDIVTDQTSTILGLSPIAESFTPLHLYTESSFVIEHPDIVTDQYPQTDVEAFAPDLLHSKSCAIVEQPDIVTDGVLGEDIDQTLKDLDQHPSIKEMSPVKVLEHQIAQQSNAENLPPTTSLVVKVQCPGFSVDLKLNPEPMETLKHSLNDSDNELFTNADISTIPLPDNLIHKMIEIYRKFPQLWNPNHLDFNSRTLRRQAWCALTTEFNSEVEKQISWRTLHRKLTDYAKYYRKLLTEQEDYERLQNKWAFYEDFKFLDDVIAVNNELQRSVHHRDNNFKIIAIYKTLSQLWDTKHSDYNKRGNKQRNIEIMCNKLQEENDLHLTTERLKNRLIELRTQYRTAKKQRLKCLKNKQKFSANEFEYYEALNFLDDHIDPFICDRCKMEFKKRTDYNQHLKKAHTQKGGLKHCTTIVPHQAGMENICHICGIKFTTRSNLVHHVKRHEGIRNYACTMCPKKFYASHSLKVHIRSHTKECPYTCEKCGISFVSASKLNQHVKRHLNKKDFQCDFCPKAFFTGFEKDRHEKRHLNIRDKACPICGKTFVAGSSYYAHLMLHNDTKRFECDKCDMKFAQYAGLYKHKKRHHE